ncbi:metal ABC transporter substrate-binding protein [Agromyces marinus]
MPRTPTRRATIPALALSVSSIALLAGCAAPGDGAGGDGVQIVATTTQVADFAGRIVGDGAEVTGLLAPGQSAHAFDPSAAQLLALGSADALVVNGAGLEEWLDDAVAASGFDGVLVDASTGIELEATDAEHHDHDHDHDHGTDGAGEAGSPTTTTTLTTTTLTTTTRSTTTPAGTPTSGPTRRWPSAWP